MSFSGFFGEMLTPSIQSYSEFFLRLIEHLEVGRHTRYIFELKSNGGILFVEVHGFRLITILL